MSGVAILFVLALGIGGTLALYALIAGETSNPEIVDRETAERKARERGGRRGAADGTSTADDDTDDRWGERDDDRWGERNHER
ncbi:hypothetical protein [Natronoarchaeum rubrum]|uniref:hypothetical protein n=1 Tax=Natronoarchaeum rubrum TaxID=755311 RepID=UPI002112699E|nr:hypothetical protein [Natronoarchaeum rubrum]